MSSGQEDESSLHSFTVFRHFVSESFGRCGSIDGPQRQVVREILRFIYPALSHRGRRYLLLRGNDPISALDLNRRRARQWATQFDDIGYAQRSRHNRYVYFNRFLGPAPAFYRVSLADGSSKRLMQLDQFSGGGGGWGTWSTFAPDGSPLLMRDLGVSALRH